MCGIVGLFLKNPALEPELGRLISAMLATMSDRGPDSAGFAVYGAGDSGQVKLTVRAMSPSFDFASLAGRPSEGVGRAVTSTLATAMRLHRAGSTMSRRRASIIEAIGDEVTDRGRGHAHGDLQGGRPPGRGGQALPSRRMAGTHAIGHTRMATELAVTTDGAHPFSTGPDQCLVHNGSLSNHNALRRG